MAPAKRLKSKPKRSQKPRVIKRLKRAPVPETLTGYVPPAHRAPIDYSFDLSERICERLANGETGTAICKDADMPTWSTLQRWIRTKPDFARRYRQARESGYEFWADDTVDIADQTQLGSIVTTQEWGTQVKTADMLEHRRLRIDARKWLLCKRARHIYGEKVQAELSGPDGEPIAVSERNALMDAIVKLVHPKDDPASKPKGAREENRER